MNYSPSGRSKPIRPSFIFGTLIKTFLMKSKSFLTLHRQQGNYHVQSPEMCQEHQQNGPCDINGSTVILWCYDFFCAQINENNNFIQQFFSPELPSTAIIKVRCALFTSCGKHTQYRFRKENDVYTEHEPLKGINTRWEENIYFITFSRSYIIG